MIRLIYFNSENKVSHPLGMENTILRSYLLVECRGWVGGGTSLMNPLLEITALCRRLRFADTCPTTTRGNPRYLHVTYLPHFL